jgi:hypothetical protein
MPTMPTLTDADCIQVYRKADMLNEPAVRMGLEMPVWGEPYVTDFLVHDGLGAALEERQYVRLDGQAYRVIRYDCGSEMDGYRFQVEKVYEPSEWRGRPPQED